MSALDDLEAKYGEPMSEKDRAELEAQIWALVPRDVRAKLVEGGERKGLVGYFHAKFSASSHQLRCRQFLQTHGAAAEPLWQRVESGLTLTSAADIMRRAAKDVGDGAVLEDAVKKRLEEYDSTGYETKTAGGKTVRRRPPSRLPEAEGGWTPPEDEAPEGRAFWTFLRKQIASFISSKLPEGDPRVRETLLRNFEVDLNVLIADFQRDLHRSPKGSLFKPERAPSRKAVLRACTTLGIVGPRSGHPVDAVKAKAQYRAHCRAYHPDIPGGTEETRDLFQAAQAAWKTIQDYNESLKETHQDTEAPPLGD
jgi:hypothetical protein